MPEPTEARLTALLGPPRIVERLSPAAVADLNRELPDRDLTVDIRILAARFAGAEANRDDPATSRLAWHHLLMAVSNLKSRGSSLHVGSASSHYLDAVSPTLVDSFVIPAPSPGVAEPQTGPAAACVRADDPSSWETLISAVRGLTVTAATAVLAAVWPDKHAMIDNLSVGTLIGLQSMDGTGTRFGTTTISDLNMIWRDVVTGARTWGDYRWFLDTIRKTVDQPAFAERSIGPLMVERALSLIGARATGYPGTQWPDWDRRLTEVISQADQAWATE